ncbi:MAG TPA: hypothetical protein DCQ06_11285, partial [Myxococcales bacterium]|nr:hypothetical protein [Myxococcales bacterium]
PASPKLPFVLTETETHWFTMLDNAAVRDRAIASLLRTYQVLLRSAFSTLRLANSFPASKSRDGLHQLARFYSSRGPAFTDLARRAALMTAHLQALRSKWKAPGKLTRKRQNRISQYRAIFDCIDRDGTLRGTKVVAHESSRAMMGGYRQELARMKLSMRCASLIARRRALR